MVPEPLGPWHLRQFSLNRLSPVLSSLGIDKFPGTVGHVRSIAVGSLGQPEVKTPATTSTATAITDLDLINDYPFRVSGWIKTIDYIKV